MENTCFICGVDRFTLDTKGGGFERHIKNDHNMWAYLFMLCYIYDKEPTDCNGWEQYIQEKIAAGDVDFLPRHNAVVLREFSLAEEAEGRRLLERVEAVSAKVDAIAAAADDGGKGGAGERLGRLEERLDALVSQLAAQPLEQRGVAVEQPRRPTPTASAAPSAGRSAAVPPAAGGSSGAVALPAAGGAGSMMSAFRASFVGSAPAEGAGSGSSRGSPPLAGRERRGSSVADLLASAEQGSSLVGILLSGFIFKKGTINTAFKRRYLVLYSEGTLAWFADEKDAAAPGNAKGLVQLAGARVVQDFTSPSRFRFTIDLDTAHVERVRPSTLLDITASATRAIVLEAETADGRDQWVQAVRLLAGRQLGVSARAAIPEERPSQVTTDIP